MSKLRSTTQGKCLVKFQQSICRDSNKVAVTRAKLKCISEDDEVKSLFQAFTATACIKKNVKICIFPRPNKESSEFTLAE